MAASDIQALTDIICFQSHSFLSVDRYDIERILQSCKHTDGFCFECEYTTYPTKLSTFTDITSKENLALTEVLVYIDTAPQDHSFVNKKRISTILQHIGALNLESTVNLTAGFGTNKNISTGHFKLLILAGYQ